MKALRSNSKASTSGLGRLAAAVACLALVVAPSFGASPGTNRGSAGPTSGDDESDSASGDETVGTLPMLSSDDGAPPVGPAGGPHRPIFERLSRDGGLVLEGPLDDVTQALATARMDALVAVHVDAQGIARAYVLGDFQMRMRPQQLAGLDLALSVHSEQGLAASVDWNRRTSQVALAGGDSLDLPLGRLLGSPALLRSPLVVDSVNAWGNGSRLTLGLDEQGFVRLAQSRR